MDVRFSADDAVEIAQMTLGVLTEQALLDRAATTAALCEFHDEDADKIQQLGERLSGILNLLYGGLLSKESPVGQKSWEPDEGRHYLASDEDAPRCPNGDAWTDAVKEEDVVL